MLDLVERLFEPKGYVKGSLLVCFKDKTTESEARKIVAKVPDVNFIDYLKNLCIACVYCPEGKETLYCAHLNDLNGIITAEKNHYMKVCNKKTQHAIDIT
jgi:hypothetical protein